MEIPTTLLKTKLTMPPARTGIIVRPRLLQALAIVPERPFTLISAPAGYGKTTLVASWLSERKTGGGRIGWLSLDERDNDPARFWAYVIAALHRGEAGGAAARALLQAQPSAVDAVVEAILDELAAVPSAAGGATDLPGNDAPDARTRATGSLVLVLDDYHCIEAPAIHHGLAYLVDHLPVHVHLVLVTRSDPPLPLARWRVRGQLAELRANDLRFSVDEAALFLQATGGQPLSDAAIAVLVRRTEGWAAGLQLAALALPPSPDPSDLRGTVSGSDRAIAGYLVDEVLQRQPPEIQAFLMRTAILDRLCGPLCDALLEDAGERGHPAALTLEELERANLFLVPLDRRREWYRYHHLFAELLRDRLRRAQPDLMPVIHRRASAWFAANDAPSEAIGHALAAADIEGAAALIEVWAHHFVGRGEIATVSHWLGSLPPAVVATRIRLALADTWIRILLGDWAAIGPLLSAAEQALTGDGSASDGPKLLAEIDGLRAIVAIEHGDVSAATVAAARQALMGLPPDRQPLRGAVAYALGVAARTRGDHRNAVAAFSEALAIGEASENLVIALAASYDRAALAVEAGALRQAETLHRAALDLAARQLGATAGRFALTGAAHVGLGGVLYERNQLDAARERLERGVVLVEQRGGLGIVRDAYLRLAWLAQALGQPALAEQWLERTEAIVQGAPRSTEHQRVQVQRARLALLRGELAMAECWARAQAFDLAHPEAAGDVSAYVAGVLVALATSRAAGADTRHAIAGLARLVEQTEAQGQAGRTIELLAVQALVYQALGQTEAAWRAIGRSLALAEPEGYMRLFVDLGAPMAALLAHTERRTVLTGSIRSYVQQLLAAFAEALRVPPSPVTQPLVEPLSERELEVLRLLCAGLSNQEIAARLLVAEGTIKKHTSNIFGKLGVRGRTQAALRAVELGLVPRE